MEACPICERHFYGHNIQAHVEQCLLKAQSFNGANRKLGSNTRIIRTSNDFSAQEKSAKNSLSTTPKRSLSSTESQNNIQNYQSMKKQKQEFESISAPVAEKLRPTTLELMVGQEDILGLGKPLRRMLESGNIPNMILWGPPGCGKTSLAFLISKLVKGNTKFISLSATNATVASLRDVFVKAASEYQLLGRSTVIFVDEIHRFTKSQQDIFLPCVENGTIRLIGATTENPSFEINSALLSRCKTFVLNKIAPSDVKTLLLRAANSGLLSEHEIKIDDKALEYLAHQCNGDARVALNSLEMAVHAQLPWLKDEKILTESDVKTCFSRSHALYDRQGDAHFDFISALHKSIRGSDSNATLYWLARMLEGGENPLYIARRFIRVASEDIGLADSQALSLSVAAFQACHTIGMPECDVILAHCAVYLARAPKSIEVYKAYKNVKQHLAERSGIVPDVPLHLRNAPTALMKELGYNKDYKYNPDYEGIALDQTYLPHEILGTNFFTNN